MASGLLILAPLLGFGTLFQDDAVAHEWRLRRWALEEAARPELEEALTSDDWRERVAALEACERALASGSLLPEDWQAPVVASLRDPHPNVRAHALGALRVSGMGGMGGATVQLAPDVVAALAADVLPAVRLALARALEVVGCDAQAQVLSDLLGDSDERVAAAALQALCARSSGAPEARALAELLPDLEPELRLRAITWLLRSEPDPALLAALRREFGGKDEDTRSWRALLEALALARGQEADVQRLVAGWAGAGEWEPRRQQVFQAAARAGDEELTVACLRALASGPPGQGGVAGLERSLQMRHELLEGALASSGPSRTLELARELELSGAALRELLPVAGRVVDTWAGLELEAWATSDDAELRRALVEGLAATFARTGDPTAGAELTRALHDGDAAIAAIAFRTLCEAEPPGPWIEALYAAWTELSAELQDQRLAWLPRDVPLPPFRAELLERGAAGDDRVCELLAGFRGDEEVRQELEAWLAEASTSFLTDAAGSPDGGRQDELRIMGQVRALARVDAAASVPALARVLLTVSVGRSSEIGKVAARGLGLSPAGRAVLEDFVVGYFDGDEERRTRIEAAIWLASAEDAPRAAVEALIRDFEHAAWDLRGRMLLALAKSDLAPASDFLAALLLDESAALDDRLTVLGTLGGDPARATRLLEQVTESTRVADLRLAALGRLGSSGGEPGRVLLARLFEENVAAPATTPEEAATRALVHGVLLEALAAAGGAPDLVVERWLAAPLGRAAADLQARFRGTDLPAVDFAWRGELALARSLAREGRAADALARNPGWTRLDGRLAGALGQAAAAGGDPAAAARLQAAAVVALLGERDAPAEALALARCRLLGLAWAEERWEASASLATQLQVLRREGELPRQVFQEAFGTFDRERGIDPEARLSSLRWQARAWAALARDEPERARRLAAEAAARVGFSELARAEQARLEAAL